MPAKRAYLYILKCADRTLYIGTAKAKPEDRERPDLAQIVTRY